MKVKNEASEAEAGGGGEVGTGTRYPKCAICGSMFLKSKIDSANNRGTCYACHSRMQTKKIGRVGINKAKSVRNSLLGKYLVVDENKQSYFQCDLCPFSCEPFSDVFTHHYRSQHPKANIILADEEKGDVSMKFFRPNEFGKRCYLCDECEFSCLSRSDFLRHYWTHGKLLMTVSDQVAYRDNAYVCLICDKKYSMLKNARRHAKRVHCDKKYECNVCRKRFAQEQKAFVHERRHSQTKSYSCDKCRREFVHKKNLIFHQSSKLCDRYTCHWCNETFLKKDTLRQHVHECDQRIEMVPDEPKSFECSNCNQQFTTKIALRRHVIAENNLTPYPCRICAQTFATVSQLDAHAKKCLIIDHDDELYVLVNADETYSCKICGKTFLKIGYLRQHVRVHSGVKPYVCQFCGKAYALRSSLQSHMLTEMNLRRYACSVCGKRYNTSSHLTAHTKKHHRLREYKCVTCDKEFAYLRDLNEHEKSHNQVKPFFCDKCGGFFKTERYLKKHLVKCSTLKKK